MVEDSTATLATLDPARTQDRRELRSGDSETTSRAMASLFCDDCNVRTLLEASVQVRNLLWKSTEDSFDFLPDLGPMIAIAFLRLLRLNEIQLLKVDELTQYLFHGSISNSLVDHSALLFHLLRTANSMPLLREALDRGRQDTLTLAFGLSASILPVNHPVQNTPPGIFAPLRQSLRFRIRRC